MRWLTGPAPELDSSSTGGVYCVSGRIPALSVSDPLHHPRGLAFSPMPMTSLPWTGRFRKVSLPSGFPLGTSRMLDGTLHRVAEAVGSKAAAFSVPLTACLGRAFRPTAHWFARFKARCARIHLHNEFLQAILPAFTVPTRTSDLVQPLREYGRLMGSDSHPRILRLLPLISRRIDYLRRSRIFRQLTSCDHRMQGDENLHSATWVNSPSYTPLSGLHWKPALQSSRKGPITRSRPLSCGHHPAAFRVIPSFREGVY